MVISMMESGRMARNMEEEYSQRKMDQDTKGSFYFLDVNMVKE
jgi:hypothetical protein